MGNKLTYVQLGDLCDQDRGITYGIVKVGEFVSGGVPVIRGGDIRDSRIVFDDHKRVTNEISNKFKRTILKGGEIVINLIAEPGHTAIVPSELIGANVSRDVAVIPLNDTVDHRYVDYCLKSPEAVLWLTSRLQGGVTQKINLGILRELPIPVPGIEEQKAIARILGALDDKLELNRRMNRTLEAMAQAIFRSWFVDFEPVSAKREGRKPVGMDDATAALFPEHFQESSMGPVPTGWRRGSTSDIARYVNGKNFTKDATGTGRMVIRIAELNSGPAGSTIYNDIKADSENTAFPGDLLFSWSGSLDVYRWHRNEALVNQHIFKVVCDEYPQWFVHFHLQEAMSFFQGVAADKATTMGHIKREHLSQPDVALPPKELIAAASRIIQPIYDRMLRSERQILSLSAQRDTLLPQLLSGELRVSQAEEMIP